jgi:DNA-binding transcriptional LysR family regulator
MRKFDLNLTRLLVALADSGSVSKAARALEMSQPGVSTALAKARRQLGDELFVPTAGGMLPTERAKHVIRTARSILDMERHGILEPPGFNAATWRGIVRLAMQDVAEAVFLPRLIGRLRLAAPEIRFHCVDVIGNALHASLADGTVNLAVGYYPNLDTQSIPRQRLYLHTYACIVRKDHPVLKTGLDLRAYKQLGHVLVTSATASAGAMRKTLASRGIERRAVVELPHVMAIPAVVEATDLIATVPLAVAESLSREGQLKVLPAPFPPTYIEVQQYWHRTSHHDPRTIWLRRQIAELFNDQSDRWRQLELSLYGKRR